MEFLNWYLNPLKKYVQFDGRASVKEFWMFFLCNFIVELIIGFIQGILDISILGGIYSLAILLPSLALAIRRLHDQSKAGWWILVSLIPLIGWIWYIVLMCLSGTVGPNQYGEDPKDTQYL